MARAIWVLSAILMAYPSLADEAGKPKDSNRDNDTNVPGERPFDAVNIFGDWGKIFRLPNTGEKKIWWERMVRGEVGRDRFLILCAMKDGNWTKFGDIRDFVEFQMREIYTGTKLQEMLSLMAGRQRVYSHGAWRLSDGEGWLERNLDANYSGNDSEWRIEPSAYPLLYFLLMSCPEEDRCH